jgi:hypothetical protein
MALHYSHDQYYFNRIRQMVAGEVRFPQLHLENQEIARRHLRAWLLDWYFQNFGATAGSNVFESWGKVGEFRLGGVQTLATGVKDAIDVLTARARTMLGENMPVKDWIDALPREVERSIENRADDAELLSALIEAQLLPRYGFPIDVVSLYTNYPDSRRDDEPVQRDRGIALSEYGPGGEIVVDGHIHRSVALFDPFGGGREGVPDAWYYECRSCRNVDVEEDTDGTTPVTMTQCSLCQLPTEPRRTITPTGFRTEWSRQRVYRGGGRETIGYASPARLLPGTGAGADDSVTEFDGRLNLRQRQGSLLMVNAGDGGEGFLVCPECGYGLDEPHRKPVWQFGRWNFQTCSAPVPNRLVLAHEFSSEVVLARLNWPAGYGTDPTTRSGKASLHSLAYALARAAGAYLQVEPSELAVGVQPYSIQDEFGAITFGGDVYLYDTLPGGAGYARDIAANIASVIERGIELVTSCPTECDSACYRCLLDYGNQRHHGLLDRMLARDILRFVIDGALPTLTTSEEESLLDRLGSFATADAQFTIESTRQAGVYGCLTRSDGRRAAVKPIHTLELTGQAQRLAVAGSTGIASVVTGSAIELARQPLSIWTRAIEEAR